MQAEVLLHLPNLYRRHGSRQYTFVNACCGEERKLFNNVTCNHGKPSSDISQLHPFDSSCWRALPNYGTESKLMKVVHNGMTYYLGHTKTVDSLWCHCRENFYWSHLFIAIIGGQAHAFIHTPQRVICRQLSHTWKKFYFQSSDWLFSWLSGQLDCRCSPARAWKPEANQSGFASASSALE
ncbi:hypothetical protein O181_066854 [Austropuccinia psidii MF-1]|uniref:Uncharacterized protein n=1 Tax=Austropuccinia psidii MF-1 TaxID=1389203 RepID=A0A9Q3I5Y4_9BASI|nr:hypothetical protein [Austropuccinia psidii MF-1]